MFEISGKIRIVLNRPFKEGAGAIFRGQILEESTFGIRFRGREYAQQLNTTTSRYEEKPLDQNEKEYFIPYPSISYAELIHKDTPEDKLDEIIQKEPLVKRKGRIVL